MGRVILNRTLIFFQSLAFFLLVMLIVYLIVISRSDLWQICLFSSCVIPVYIFILMVYLGGTFLSPIKVEVYDNSVIFINLLKSRTKSIPYNRIKKIRIPGKGRSNQVVIMDNHGAEHKFYMVNYRISKEILAEYDKFKKKKKKEE